VAQRDLRRVRQKAEKIEKAREELELAILAAVASGESLRDIAPYAGISYSHLHKIIQEAQRRERG
jgi:helix-turn-helix protein